MPYVPRYSSDQPSRENVAALPGAVVLEFGTQWCGYCTAAQPAIATAFEDHRQVQHLKVEDGKGRPLGRSFGVKLWPTLVFLRDGQEVARVVRPHDAGPLREAMARIAGAAG